MIDTIFIYNYSQMKKIDKTEKERKTKENNELYLYVYI